MKNTDKAAIKDMRKKIAGSLKVATKRLEAISKETKDFVRRGEDELAKITRLGKAQFEILALSVKKEQLYRQIGKKVWQLAAGGKLTTKKLRSFCRELSAINKKVKTRRRSVSR